MQRRAEIHNHFNQVDIDQGHRYAQVAIQNGTRPELVEYFPASQRLQEPVAGAPASSAVSTRMPEKVWYTVRLC